MTPQEIFAHWKEVREKLTEGLRATPPEKLEWKPEGAVRGIGSLFRHIARAESFWIGQVVLGGERRSVDDEHFPSREAIASELEKIHELSEILLSKAKESDLKHTFKVDWCDEELSLFWILWHLVEHEAHHRGQIFMLLRMAGIDPPET